MIDWLCFINKNGHATIPQGVTSIGHSTFWRCSGLTSVTIPQGVTSIGRAAFGSCSGLTSVTIPEKLKRCIAYFDLSTVKTLSIIDLRKRRINIQYLVSKPILDGIILFWIYAHDYGLPIEMIEYILSFYSTDMVLCKLE